MTGQAMTTTYSVKLAVLRRFGRIVGTAFVAGGVPGAVLTVQSPEIYELGTQLSARRAWPRARWRPWTRPCGRGSGPGWEPSGSATRRMAFNAAAVRRAGWTTAARRTPG